MKIFIKFLFIILTLIIFISSVVAVDSGFELDPPNLMPQPKNTQFTGKKFRLTGDFSVSVEKNAAYEEEGVDYWYGWEKQYEK